MIKKGIRQELPGRTKLVPGNAKPVDRDEPVGGLITDHKYAPMNEWWTRCRYCRLAQAAHAESEIQYYSDD
jgi:hypothetical protein